MADTRDSASGSREPPGGRQQQQVHPPERSSELSVPWGGIPPVPLGSANALQAVSEVASPLLAGFSIALVGVIAQSPGSFRWAASSLLVLTFAAGLLLLAVEAGFHARQLYWTRDDLLAWYKDSLTQKSEEIFSYMHRKDRDQWEAWKNWTRYFYNAGIVLLMLGIAIMLAPPATYGTEPISISETMLRWSAAGVAAAVAVAEAIWWSYSAKLRERTRKNSDEKESG